jgi:hypothetical protein
MHAHLYALAKANGIVSARLQSGCAHHAVGAEKYVRFAMKILTAFVALALLGVTAAQAGNNGQIIITDLCTKFPKLDQKLDNTKLCMTSAPEIDPATAIGGVALLLGGLAVVRGRVMKQKQD